MFDWIGSYELIFILVLAGIVMGPKRIASFAAWLGKTTAYLQNVSRGFAAQLKNELEAIDGDGDMKDMLSEMRDLQKEVNTLRQQINETATTALTQTKEVADETKTIVSRSIRPPSFPESSNSDSNQSDTNGAGSPEAATQNGSTDGLPDGTPNGKSPVVDAPPPPLELPNLVEVPDDEE